MADRLTEQLVETADAIQSNSGQHANAGASLGVKTAVIKPVPRRAAPQAPARSRSPVQSSASCSTRPPTLPHSSRSHDAQHVWPASTSLALYASDDDESGDNDGGQVEEPVRLTQIISPRSGKTRTVVCKPAEPPTAISTGVGSVVLPSFMRSGQAAKAQERNYSPPPEWLASVLSRKPNTKLHAFARPETLDHPMHHESFDSVPPAISPPNLHATSAAASFEAFQASCGPYESAMRAYQPKSSSPFFLPGTPLGELALLSAPSPQLSPPLPLPFSLPGQYASPASGGATRFTPPTSVTPIYESQMTRGAHAFDRPTPVGSGPSLAREWSPQLLDRALSSRGDSEYMRVPEDTLGPPAIAECQPFRHELQQQHTFEPRRSLNDTSFGHKQAFDSLLPLHSYASDPKDDYHTAQEARHTGPNQFWLGERTPPPNPKQTIQALGRARRAARLEEAAASAIGPVSPLLFVSSLEPSAAAAAAAWPLEREFSPSVSPPTRFPSVSDASAGDPSIFFEQFRTPSPRLPASAIAQVPAAKHGNSSRPGSTSSYLTEVDPPAPAPGGAQEIASRSDASSEPPSAGSVTVREQETADARPLSRQAATNGSEDPAAMPTGVPSAAPLAQSGLPFAIYEDSDPEEGLPL
ncbi:hypothetical protein JCM10908_007207 [Rhodotorula pacifica]|uniref:uncharacterized protein n=1 Tax=Rhodotorula pacifica TaxID=1495444 RepID=UPI0031820CC0